MRKLITAAMALLLVMQSPAGAQVEPEFQANPTSGAPGSQIAVSGAECVDDNGDAGETVAVGLKDLLDSEAFLGGIQRFTPAEDGTWSGSFIVPLEILPADGFFLVAICQGLALSVERQFSYAPRTFNVTDEPPASEGLPGQPGCSDGIDNDQDGVVDVDDPDCQADTPPPTGTEGPAGDPTCSDGIDNDRDRLVDLDDPDCQADNDNDKDGNDNDKDGNDRFLELLERIIERIQMILSQLFERLAALFGGIR